MADADVEIEVEGQPLTEEAQEPGSGEEDSPEAESDNNEELVESTVQIQILEDGSQIITDEESVTFLIDLPESD